jgi:hypothetical protein
MFVLDNIQMFVDSIYIYNMCLYMCICLQMFVYLYIRKYKQSPHFLYMGSVLNNLYKYDSPRTSTIV